MLFIGVTIVYGVVKVEQHVSELVLVTLLVYEAIEYDRLEAKQNKALYPALIILNLLPEYAELLHILLALLVNALLDEVLDQPLPLQVLLRHLLVYIEIGVVFIVLYLMLIPSLTNGDRKEVVLKKTAEAKVLAKQELIENGAVLARLQ